MSRIWLTDRLEDVDEPRGGRTLWIYPAKGWPEPKAERVMTDKAFLEDPWTHLRGIDRMVIVGLVSRITTPSNRVKTGQFFTDPLPDVERVSVDPYLFLRDPWRMWLHFGCVGINFGGCHHSFACENQWSASIVGKRDNPCTVANLDHYGTGVIRAPLPFRFDHIDIHIEEMDAEAHDAYQREKEAAFEEERTPTAVIKRLAKAADQLYLFRTVPDYTALFKSRHVHVRATDLGIDRYLVGQIRDRINLINHAAEAFA